MNKDEDVELLETSSTSTTESTQTSSNVEVPQVPTGMEINSTTTINTTLSGTENSVNSSMVSPFNSKPNVVGTTANSPRISPDATFAATSHSMKHQTTPKSALKQKYNEGVVQGDVPVSDSNTSEVGTSQVSKSKPSKPVFLIVAFVLLLGTILVLPYSQDLFDKIFTKDTTPITDDIQTGDLVCTMESEDLGNSYQYTETYSFDNGEVDTLEHVVLVQGDADYLSERNNECQLLQQNAISLTGVTVECDSSKDEMIETQFFNLARFDSSSINAGFTEAGGVSPNAKKGDSYKEIQRVMEMSGYDCKIR